MLCYEYERRQLYAGFSVADTTEIVTSEYAYRLSDDIKLVAE